MWTNQNMSKSASFPIRGDFIMKKMLKKLITAATTLSIVLSSAVFAYTDEASNQEGVGNTDNNSGKSITMYYGDFDYDGKITLKDAKKALQLAVGIETVDDYYLREERSLFCDIDGGGISLTDAKEYLRMAVGITPAKKKDVSISLDGKINRYTSDDGKVEAVYISDSELTKYSYNNTSYVRLIKEYNMPEMYIDGIDIYDSRIDENTRLGTKLTLMELFDTPLSDLYNYNYYYFSFDGWCNKFGYDNFKISVENTDTTWKLKVDNSTPYLYEEIGGDDGIDSVFERQRFYFRIPKTEESYEGKKVVGELNLTYGDGFENAQDIEWSFEKLDNIDEATQSACLITNESAAPENIKDKCNFDNYDYILLSVPFNVEDCFDRYHFEAASTFEGSRTVKEMYDSGDIAKPDGFDAATYLNDRIWLNEDNESKAINIKTHFTIYERCYYEDIGNCGKALIKVEKGKYDGYKFNTQIFGNDFLDIHTMG